MSDIIIHNINVSYDESHKRVRDFVRYLQEYEKKDEMKAYYEQAKRNKDSKIHISDKFDNEFTLVCGDNHNCDLRLRGM
jgi:hypothetical protein